MSNATEIEGEFEQVLNRAKVNTVAPYGNNGKIGAGYVDFSAADAGKQRTYWFTPTHRGFCGDCQLCGLPVYYYVGDEFKTSCGQCDHFGGVFATLCAGMLPHGEDLTMVYAMGATHVHCNQAKKDTITMAFNKKNLWYYESDGAKTIADDIYNKDFHQDEYDPVFKSSIATRKAAGIVEAKQAI